MSDDPLCPAESPPRSNWRTLISRRPWLSTRAICFALFLAIFAVYLQTSQFEFISSDDDLYIVKNPHTLGGLTLPGIRWALTGVAASNWLPLTLISHMLDVQLFGLNSGAHHLVNVLLHALASILLFLVLRRATAEPAPSAFVAFVFALHPLHVESVAWISERKDVLSACFLFLALYAYVRYTEQPGLGRYVGVVVPFCLGLMSKPMLVTLPFMLLLLDLWPLRRMHKTGILWEKLPLFVLSAVASAVAYRVQLVTGAVAGIVQIKIQGRVAKALLSYITYLRQTFWPAHLAAFYPYPRYVHALQIAGAFVFLGGLTAVVVSSRNTRPYLATGWFWYLGTLIPVIGLVQVGEQSHADRYTYIPMIGVLIMLGWGFQEIAARFPRTRIAITAVAVAVCVICMALSWKQAESWRNPETLYQRALDVTPDNDIAHTNLAAYLMTLPGRRSDAVEHLEAALRIKPDNAIAHQNLGVCLVQSQLCAAAIPHFEAALREMAGLYGASDGLGFCLAITGRYTEAIPHFEEALRVNPDLADAHFHLAETLSSIPGREAEAVTQYQATLRLQPEYPDAQEKLRLLLTKLGRKI